MGVEKVYEDRVRARKEEEKVLKQRAKRAEEIRKETEVFEQRKKREDDHEMERKKDIIREIRALERVSVVKPKPFDPFEAPRGGYMEEMSLSELRERFNMLKAQRAKETEDKKELNLEKKIKKNNQFTERVEILGKIREQAKSEAQERHLRMQAKKQEEEEAKKKFQEQCTVEVAHRIAKKKKEMREEENRLRAELKEISVKRQFLAANAEMVEFKQKQEQQKGLQREAREGQREMLIKQHHAAKTAAIDYGLRIANKEEQRAEFETMQINVNKRLAKAKADDMALKEDIKAASFNASNHRRLEESKYVSKQGMSALSASIYGASKTHEKPIDLMQGYVENWEHHNLGLYETAASRGLGVSQSAPSLHRQGQKSLVGH